MKAGVKLSELKCQTGIERLKHSFYYERMGMNIGLVGETKY